MPQSHKNLHDSQKVRSSFVTLASVVALVHLVACAAMAPQPVVSDRCATAVDFQRAGIFTSSGTARLSPTSLAYFAFGLVDTAASVQPRTQGYVLVVRGEAHWSEVGGPNRAGGLAHGAERRAHLWEVARQQLAVTFDPSARKIELLGTHVGLDTANVIFIDRVDGVGGPPVIRGTECVQRLRVHDSAADLLNGVPGLREYVFARRGA